MSNDAQLLLLDKNAVEALLLPDQVLLAVREAFTLHSRREGRIFPVVREALSTGGTFGIKSGDVPSQALLGFKAAGFWPANRAVGAEPHQATILLFDPASGRPLCVVDGNAITTARTGAAGGIGLQLLARPDSRQACVFGTGVQARVQLEFALKLLPALQEVKYVSSSGKVNAAFEAYFSGRCKIALATDANAAVAASDIVITATPGAGPLFDLQAVRPGTHLNCVGTDTRGKRELPAGLLKQVRLVVDDVEQARRIGETQWLPETPCTEIGDLLTGKSVLQRHADDITVFDMTGLALQDLTVARLIQQQAMEQGMGSRIAWPW
ncbi:ornithine cyclodeaminase family protein [Undibacterium terreum]|uniref:Ornithine cyclodeaminase n=1 Tax=Undibacterium terreum TaxID=1224302 RepID=A0A916UCC2_9BURK|nr:ornithine cyclodeaminase family protein [Undibacterium terreum]GGC66625.1 ornithine cyclodeaminase [Undibacterium terreum]